MRKIKLVQKMNNNNEPTKTETKCIFNGINVVESKVDKLSSERIEL